MQNQGFTRTTTQYTTQFRAQFHYLNAVDSGDDFFDRRAKIDFQPLLAGHFEPARIESQLVQHGGVDVGDVVPVFHGMETQFIGRAMYYAALDAAAGHPGSEPERMVIPPSLQTGVIGPNLDTGRSSKFGGPDDNGVLQHAPLLQDLSAARRWAGPPWRSVCCDFP